MDSPKTPEIATPGDAITKVMGIVTKVAPFVGGLHAFLGDPIADGRGLQGAPAFIFDRISKFPLWNPNAPGGMHIPNPLTTTMQAITYHPDKYPIFSGAVSALVGWIIQYAGKAIDMGRTGQVISQMGRAMKGYGVAAATLSIPAAWLYLGMFNPGEAGGPGQTYAAGYSSGQSRGGPGATNTYWQVRGGANIRSATASVDVYPT